MAKPKRILVVDDDADLVEAVALSLEKQGFSVEKASDGIEAMDSIRARRPDLVVLDVMMPRMDGYEVCDELKSDPELKNIPVILLTAVSSQVSKSTYSHFDGMKTEADDYIAKPVDMQILMERIALLTS